MFLYSLNLCANNHFPDLYLYLLATKLFNPVVNIKITIVGSTVPSASEASKSFEGA